MTRTLSILIAGAIAGAMTAPATAQMSQDVVVDAPKVYFACYAPLTGVVYRIKEPGLPAACFSSPDGKYRHIEFNWNARGPEGAVGPQGPVGPPGAAGAAGEKGADGTAGAPGAAGEKGADGAMGAQGAQGPAGPQGPQGVQGPQGPAGSGGISGLSMEFNGESVINLQTKTNTVFCPVGKVVVGGGAHGEGKMQLLESAPTRSAGNSGAFNGWTATAYNPTLDPPLPGFSIPVLRVYAFCVNP